MALLVCLGVALACAACGDDDSTKSLKGAPEFGSEGASGAPSKARAPKPDNAVELTAKLRIVFISSGRSQALRIYVVRGKSAHLLELTKKTRCISIPAAAEGDGLLVSSLNGGKEGLLHSRSTYRVRGHTKPVEPRDALMSFETKLLVVDEIECIEMGTGRCQGFPAIRVPPTGGGSGWVPVLPDSVKGKKGVFVQAGVLGVRAEMMNVPSKKEPVLIPAIRSVGSIKMNDMAEWAKVADD